MAALEAYVREGGGLAVFVGSDTDRTFYNDRFYHNGAGLFPVPLRLPTQLLDRSGESAPDVEVADDPLFRVLSGRRNSLLPLLLVDYYYALPEDWAPPADGSTRVIARLRNQAPLVVSKTLGKGHVVAQLTRLSSGQTPLGPWTNWSLNPAFPVLANELVNSLAAGSDGDELFHVGDDLVVTAPENNYESTIRVVLAGEGAARAQWDLDATPSAGQLVAKKTDVPASGIYHAELALRQGGVERRDYAFNVVTDGEGDLELVGREDLARQLAGVKVELHDAADMLVDREHLAGFQMGDTLLGALIVLLLGEQLLAYSASYHIRS
jgi:dipeptidyl aminopeptidase/acylaminoacyl peptidase